VYFDISCPNGISYFDGSIKEIGTRIGIPKAGINDFDRLSFCCLKPGFCEKLVFPGILLKFFIHESIFFIEKLLSLKIK
jgi:hypothetical protein